MSQVTAEALQNPKRPKTPRVAVAGILLFAVGALVPLFVGGHLWISLLRWSGLAIVAATALKGQALTRWILLSMLIGGEIGFDWPQFAEHSRVLSDIFLR